MHQSMLMEASPTRMKTMHSEDFFGPASGSGAQECGLEMMFVMAAELKPCECDGACELPGKCPTECILWILMSEHIPGGRINRPFCDVFYKGGLE